MLQVLDRHLRLAIRSQPPALATLAHVGQGLPEPCGHGVGQRHAVGGLIAGISEHDSLVAGTHIHLVLMKGKKCVVDAQELKPNAPHQHRQPQTLLAHVHSAGDVWALLVDAHQDFALEGWDLGLAFRFHLRRAAIRRQGAGLVAQALAVHAGQVIHKAVKADLLHDAPHHLVVVELGSGGDLLGSCKA